MVGIIIAIIAIWLSTLYLAWSYGFIYGIEYPNKSIDSLLKTKQFKDSIRKALNVD